VIYRGSRATPPLLSSLPLRERWPERSEGQRGVTEESPLRERWPERSEGQRGVTEESPCGRDGPSAARVREGAAAISHAPTKPFTHQDRTRNPTEHVRSPPSLLRRFAPRVSPAAGRDVRIGAPKRDLPSHLSRNATPPGRTLTGAEISRWSLSGPPRRVFGRRSRFRPWRCSALFCLPLRGLRYRDEPMACRRRTRRGSALL
jgi:hypothetical protein